MTEEARLRKYLRARKTLQRKLNDIDRKLNHIIFRLREEDPRINGPDSGRLGDEWADSCNRERHDDTAHED